MVVTVFLDLSVTICAGADGTWNTGGNVVTPLNNWSNETLWISAAVADGQDGTAYFNTVDEITQWISLEYGSRTIGHLIFGDTNPDTTNNWWNLCRGTLNLKISSGTSTVEVNNVTTYIENDLTLNGNFIKTGNGALIFNGRPAGSIDVEAGTLYFRNNADNINFTNQSISGPCDIFFESQQNGYYTFRNDYTGVLNYTGRTVVNLSDNSGNTWYQGTLWLEKDDVFSHSSVLELQSGKVYTREQTGNGLTIAGLTGNAGTYITTDRDAANIQKWTINVADGQSYTYAGVIGADGTGTGNDNISLAKAGLGTQILSGSNTFIGNLIVSDGTLLVNNTSGSGSGINNTVTVASGATLGGTGTILSTNTTIQTGGALAPGGTNMAGTLTFNGDVTVETNTVYYFDYSSSATDMVTVGGILTLPNVATVNLTSIGGTRPSRRATLFTANALSGAVNLRMWKVQGAGMGETYFYFSQDGTNVFINAVDKGLVIIIR